MSPDELKGRRAATRRWRPAEKAYPFDRAGSGRWRWRASGSLPRASPRAGRVGATEPRQWLTALEAHCRTSTSSCSSARARWPRPRQRPSRRAGTLQEELGCPAGGGGSAAAPIHRFGQRRQAAHLRPELHAGAAAAGGQRPACRVLPAIGWSGCRHRSGAAGGGSRHGDEVRSVDSSPAAKASWCRWRWRWPLSSLSSRQTQVERSLSTRASAPWIPTAWICALKP